MTNLWLWLRKFNSKLIYSLNQNHQHFRRGFTLLELLVVISIISILSIVGISTYSNIQIKARDSRRIGDINAIAAAIEANYIKNTGTPYPLPMPCFFEKELVPQDPRNVGTFMYSYWNRNIASTPQYFSSLPIPANCSLPPPSTSAYVYCAKLELPTGNSADWLGNPVAIAADPKPFYCRKNRF